MLGIKLTSVFMLLGVHVLPFLIWRNEEFSTSTVKISALLSGVVTIPYFVMLCMGFESPIISSVSSDTFSDLARFSLLYSTGFIVFQLVVLSCQGIQLPGFGNSREPNESVLLLSGTILLLLFTATSFIKVANAGGFWFLIQNLQMRAQLLSGGGIYDVFLQPAAFLSIFLFLYCKGIYGRPANILLVLIFCFVFIVLSVYGGRKLPMFLILFILFASHQYVAPIKIYSVKMLVAVVFMGLFFVAMYQFRGSTGISSDGNVLSQSVFEVFRNLSYIDTYVFIMEYFGSNGYWFGAHFGDLLVRFAPGGEGNPPLDDGVYVRSLYAGIDVYPPTSYDLMFKSSWPPETFGGGYMSFGVLGVYAFFAVRGIVLVLFFKLSEAADHAPIPYFIFLFSVFNFHLTNLRVMQMMMILVPVYLLIPIIMKISRTRVLYHE